MSLEQYEPLKIRAGYQCKICDEPYFGTQAHSLVVNHLRWHRKNELEAGVRRTLARSMR